MRNEWKSLHHNYFGICYGVCRIGITWRRFRNPCPASGRIYWNPTGQEGQGLVGPYRHGSGGRIRRDKCRLTMGGNFMKMNAAISLVAGIFVALFSEPSSADCVCRCVNGQMQPLCQNAIDLPPICPPTVCGITPPSIAPIQPPRVPPIGTTNCRQAQIQNPRTGQYEWREVCRYSSLHSEQMANGEIVYSDNKPDEWYPIPPSTINAEFWKIACGKK